MPLTTQAAASVSADLTSAAALGSLVATVGSNRYMSWASGTGADQADKIFTGSGTINASTTTTLDLAGGLTDPSGAAVTFVKVKLIFLKNTHATQALALTRPASNGVPFLTAAGDAIPIPPGGHVHLVGPGAAGLATVTAGTGDLIDLVNGAGSSVTYDIVLVGTSA